MAKEIDLAQTWETYTSSWKETAPEKRQHLFSKALSAKCTYTDPLVTLAGHGELHEYVEQFHGMFPKGVHMVTTYFLAHHQKSVARWNMCDGAGEVLSDGMSVGEYDVDGKLLSMTGFFETPPA